MHLTTDASSSCFKRVKVSLPAYAWEGEVIWGATAIMLTEFALAWREAVERV